MWCWGGIRGSQFHRRRLHDACAGVEIAKAIGQAAAGSALRTLDLSYCGLGNGAAAALAELLTDQGAAAAASAAAGGSGGGRGIQQLLLSGNSSIGPAGAGVLERGIRCAGPQLSAVDLTETSVGGPGSFSRHILLSAAETWRQRHALPSSGGGAGLADVTGGGSAKAAGAAVVADHGRGPAAGGGASPAPALLLALP